MIGKITRGASARGLSTYLHGPGRDNEHAYFRGGQRRSGGVVIGGNLGVARDESGEWGQVMDAVIAQRPQVRKGVWHCSIRAAPDDPMMGDGQWHTIAESVVERLGVAESHPWTVVRHGPDHVHIAVSRVSSDGRQVWKASHDFRGVESALREAEQTWNLTRVRSPQRGREARENPREPTRHSRVTGGESARAMRTGTVPDRTALAELVRAARDSSGGRGRGEFEAELGRLGVEFSANEAKNGRMSGYRFSAGHTDKAGDQVWFKASDLGRDLSWSSLSRTLDTASPVQVPRAAQRADDATNQLDQWSREWAEAGQNRRDTIEQQATGEEAWWRQAGHDRPGVQERGSGWIEQLRAEQHSARERLAGRSLTRDTGGRGL